MTSITRRCSCRWRLLLLRRGDRPTRLGRIRHVKSFTVTGKILNRPTRIHTARSKWRSTASTGASTWRAFAHGAARHHAGHHRGWQTAPCSLSPYQHPDEARSIHHCRRQARRICGRQSGTSAGRVDLPGSTGKRAGGHVMRSSPALIPRRRSCTLGFVVLVGSILALDLRVLGLGATIPIQPMAQLRCLCRVSGFCRGSAMDSLFSADAAHVCAQILHFQTKLLLMRRRWSTS